jgi:PIN domain nuclease of toxin-antitoxin system
VTLLDAYALIAFLVGGRAAAPVRSILREGDAAVTTTNLAETLDVSQRLYGLAVDRAMELIEPLVAGPLATLPLSSDLAVSAARVRARHYHRTRRAISLADAVLVASAMDGPDPRRLATADPDVLVVAREELVATVALPEEG